MNWREWHHLYLGLGYAGIWAIVVVVALWTHSLTWIFIALVNIILGSFVALDDVGQHKWGWNTPLRRLSVFLWRFQWYRELTQFFDQIFK